MSKIVVIDDVLPNALLLKGYLRRLDGVEVLTFTDPLEAFDWVKSNTPDLILLDYTMPKMDGCEFLRQFRKIAPIQDVPILMVTAEEDKEALYKSLEAGANDFLRKPVDRLELAARAKNMLALRARQLELADLNQKLYAMATTDSLTGVPNRRHFIQRLDDEITRCQRYQRTCAVAMIDADHFKSINDTHGHEIGDRVLQELSRAIVAEVRTVDAVGRLGGEEFAMLLPETDSSGALIVCERILNAIRNIKVDTGNTAISVTCSMGLTCVSVRGDSSESALRRADQALYQAKANGRNRVEVLLSE